LNTIIFITVKCYWNEALDSYRRKNPGRGNGKHQFPKPLAEAWIKAATQELQYLVESNVW
jgi:hypothetical protein